VAAAKEEKEKEAAAVLLLKTLEDMLHNRITEKKKEIYKNQSIADTETLWTQIDKDIAMGIIRESEYQDTTET
jgi:hypothetical protein